MSNIKAPAISIIVPIYQVAPHLSGCLDSILMQSFTDFELLLIDDGSTDGSGKTCDAYAKKDDRIQVFHQANQGPGTARNIGLDNARGEYITMIDADDILLSDDYLQILYDAAEQNNAEISMCRYLTFKEHEMVPDAVLPYSDAALISGRDIFSDPAFVAESNWFFPALAKLYRRDCFKEIRYPSVTLMEDLAVFHYLIYPCKRIALLDCTLYGHRNWPGNITRYERNDIKYRTLLDVLDDCTHYLKQRGESEATSYAKTSGLSRIAYYYYFKALSDGSQERIPISVRPDIYQLEENLGSFSSLLSLFRIDPHEDLQESKDYLGALAQRASEVLILARNVLFQSDASPFDVSSSPALLKGLAIDEGVAVLIHQAFLQSDEYASEKNFANKTDVEYVRSAMRRSVLLNHIKNILSQKLADTGVVVIPFVPEQLISLYPKPWYREQNTTTFLIHDEDIDKIRSTMKEVGFTEESHSPLSSVFMKDYVFSNKEHISFSFISGTPYTLFGKYHDYLSSICETVLKEKRELTLYEYAIILTIKLYKSHFATASTKLRDLLDLSMILHALPNLPDFSGFISTLCDLDLQETWNDIYPICLKLSRNDSSEIRFSAKEKACILSIIKRPFHRLSYLKKVFSPYSYDCPFIQPAEYVVSNEKHLVYYVNAKAACSSIKAALLNEPVADDHSVHRIMLQRGFIRNELSSEEKGFNSFTFVRNPFSKLVSCYESKYHVDFKKFSFHGNFVPFLFGLLSEDNGFTAFVERACALPYYMMEHHFRPQYNLFFDPNGHCRCDYIGKFENLIEDFEPVRKEHNLHPLPHLNSSDTYDWRSYYTKETAKIVYETFEKDFIAFGYEDSYRELLDYLDKKDTPVSCVYKET